MWSRIKQKRWMPINQLVKSMFGQKNLFITNALISTVMGTAGDAILQHFELITNTSESDSSLIDKNKSKEIKKDHFDWNRSLHMSVAGFTTGVSCHFWYKALDRWLGSARTIRLVTKKVLLDQIMYSPINFLIYFGTVGILEKASWKHIKQEVKEKGLQDIYVVEWFVWTPAQFINFYLLPLKYRILFDNIISLGFDIYYPFVKYNRQMSDQSTNESKPSMDVSKSTFDKQIPLV